MKLFTLSIICMVLLVGTVSAFEFDNGLRYENEDLKVVIENGYFFGIGEWFGFNEDLGSAELKSHKSVDEVLKFGYGKEEVVMYYDFNFLELYEDGLGEIYFTDERTGKEIEKDYSFVYWANQTYERNVYEEQCSKSENGTNFCENIIIGKENATRETWKPYNFRDIQKGKIRIGLKTYVDKKDYIDGVWTIGGKKVEKHAVWTADLNVDIISYYDFNEQDTTGSGTIFDSLFLNNGTNVGADNSSGKIGTGYDFISNNDDNVDLTTSSILGGRSAFTLNMWVNADNFAEQRTLYGGIASFSVLLRVEAGNLQFFAFTSGSIGGNTQAFSTTGSWAMITATYDGTTMRTFINGVQGGTSYSQTGNIKTGANERIGFYNSGTPVTWEGKMDEVSMWSRNLTQGEITDLYNGGDGITYTDIFIPSVTLNSPINLFNTSNPTINFNGTISVSTPDNVTLFIDDVGNETNTTGILDDYLFTKIIAEGIHTWNYQACNSEGCSNGTERTFTIDQSNPTINITFPTEIVNFHEINKNLSVNWTVIDLTLDTCILQFEGVNRTVTCNDNQTQINITNSINKTIIFYANDTLGNVNSSTRTWDYKILGSNNTFNTSSFETKSETFSINLTANSSLTAVVLNYNGTDYSTTQSGITYSTTLDVPTGLFNKTFKWKFTYAGGTINSPENNQNISLTNFSICDGSLTDDYLNISFKDEDDLSVLNASIPSSTFNYYLGSGTVNKTLTYVNNNLNYNYTFCATPTETLNVDSIIQYKQGTDYPQRISDPGVIQYTSAVTNQILYLLSTLDGIFVTFQVINIVEQVISGVDVTGVRDISGEDVTVASGTTDASGSVTFWLNPDFLHTFTFIKSGFETASTSIFPNQPSYTITLTGGVTGGAIDYTQGISTSFKPVGFVLNDSLINFNYTISSSFWVLEEFGFTLSYSNGTIIGTQTSTSNTGGTIGLDATTGSNGTIVMNHYYLINSTYTNGTVIWSIYKSNAFSIQHLLERVVTYIDADIMGVQSDDDGYFFKATLSVFILIALSGVLSTRYGIASEQAISGIIFGVLLLLNTLNLIPTPSGTTFTNLGNFLVGLVGFIMLMSIFKEESR